MHGNLLLFASGWEEKPARLSLAVFIAGIPVYRYKFGCKVWSSILFTFGLIGILDTQSSALVELLK